MGMLDGSVRLADGTHTCTWFVRCESASRRSLTLRYSGLWSFCLIRTQQCLNGDSKFRLTHHTVPHHGTQYRCDSVMGEVNYTSTPSSLYHWTDVSDQLHDPAGLLPGKCDTKNFNSLSLPVCCFVRILTFLRLHYDSLLNNKKTPLLAWSAVPGAYGRDAFFRYAVSSSCYKRTIVITRAEKYLYAYLGRFHCLTQSFTNNKNEYTIHKVRGTAS